MAITSSSAASARSAYLIFEDRPNGFHIARLSDDYLDVARDVCLIRAKLEGGAIVRHDGLYYCLGSALTGWNPNPNKYATAKQLEGPWSDWKDIAPPEKKTYGSQSTFLLKIPGNRATTVIFMADMWRPRTQWDSRYLWMPLGNRRWADVARRAAGVADRCGDGGGGGGDDAASR